MMLGIMLRRPSGRRRSGSGHSKFCYSVKSVGAQLARDEDLCASMSTSTPCRPRESERRAPTAEAELARPDGKETVMNNEGRKAHLVGSGIANLDGEGMPSCGERGDKILARAGMRQLRR